MSNTSRPYERVAAALRGRLAAGEWRPGELIPGRRALAAEYGVAPATLERAAGMLIAEGALAVSDRRGTYVAELPSKSSAHPAGPAVALRNRERLVAKVGIVASVIPYEGPFYETQWPVQVLHGCEHQLASEAGVTMRFQSTIPAMGRSERPFAEVATELLEARVDAVIWIGQAPTPELLGCFSAAKVPCVLAAFHPVARNIPQVYIDGAAGGALAACHLMERGYKRLLYFRPFLIDWVEERLAGVRSALENPAAPEALLVLPLDPVASVLRDGDQSAIAFRCARKLLDAGLAAGAGVIAPNDAVAMGFMEAAAERGLKAGRDYGMVGFDDRRREAHLTSLRPPLGQLGEEAAGLVLRLLRGEAAPARMALQHRLIARGSTAPWVSRN